jgi:hypothetical protein
MIRPQRDTWIPLDNADTLQDDSSRILVGMETPRISLRGSEYTED